jgi:hypothetical protein
MNNPFDTIDKRLQNIEHTLLDIKFPPPPKPVKKPRKIKPKKKKEVQDVQP